MFTNTFFVLCCKDTEFLGEMQENGEKIAIFSLEAGDTRMIFGAINKERRGFTRGRSRKVHPKTPRAFRGLPEQDSQEEGERQYRMYQRTRRELAGIAASTKQPMAMANINKQHFLLAGSCAVVLSVFSRSSLGGRREGIRGVNEIGILRNGIYSLPQAPS